MSWGLSAGIIFVGILGKIPREYVIACFGKPGTLTGILRAVLAGVLLDTCSHGILFIGMKLYERGASTAQVIAFLLASPWNSLSLTILLFVLIGPWWTLLFIVLSAVIAIVAGLLFHALEKRGVLPKNVNSISLPENFKIRTALAQDMRKYKFKISDIYYIIVNGLRDSLSIIKWVLLGAILTSMVRTFMSQNVFEQYFGPSLIGLGATLLATILIEVCSEGGAPLASDFLTRAAAPGNSFTFLMAGVSADYTEILALKSTTKSWKVALFLPLLTIPQILIIGYILNVL